MRSTDVFKNTPKAMTVTSTSKNKQQYVNSVDEQYCNLFQRILDEGEWEENRTGIRTKRIFGAQVKMDMREGFSIFTTRQMPFKSFTAELECFIQGFTSKEEFVKRGCKWWGSWCNPQIVPYANNEETLQKMKEVDDLGVIYGAQIRNFSDPNNTHIVTDFEETENGYIGTVAETKGVDQLKILVDKIKNGVNDRRLIVNMWNPLALDHMALVPCHRSFQVNLSSDGKYLDLMWDQRSVDLALGANNTLYGILIHLLAHECGREPRYLIANYGDVHIYENQIEQVKEQIQRPTHKLPTLKIHSDKFTDIFDWTHDCVELVGYEHSGKLIYPQAAV